MPPRAAACSRRRMEGPVGRRPTRGFPAIPVFSLAIDPKTPTTVYAGTFGRGVFKSTDAGGHWTPVPGGFGDDTVLSFAIDPSDPATIYSGTTASSSSTAGTVFSPASAVIKSSNGGLAWTAANGGLPRAIVTTLAIDPSNPAVLYAGTSAGGVFKTANGGLTWTPANAGIGTSDISHLVVDPSQLRALSMPPSRDAPRAVRLRLASSRARTAERAGSARTPGWPTTCR